MEDETGASYTYRVAEVPDIGSLKKQLETEGFFVQKVSDSIARTSDFSIIGNNTIDDFIKFAKRTKTTIVMIDSTYIGKESCTIDLDIYSDDFKILDKEVNKFNESLDSVDFSVPYDTILFFLYEGWPFGIKFANSKLASLARTDERLQSLLDDHSEEIDRIRGERQKKICEMEDSLMEKIVCDPDFQICVNQASRMEYLKRYLERPENREAKELLSGSYGAPTNSSLKGFGDRAWALVKARKKGA
ncbi:hypothetical protein O8W32_02525 [Methanomassiliicoccales archaeon LGM-DZ1]|nr:hypothetical protein O8W32_02525 [Methanomassiliicoccales archaeon LGM-DZ1]